jgi:hypothetical protein
MKKNKFLLDILLGFILTAIIFTIMATRQANELGEINISVINFFKIEPIASNMIIIRINPITLLGLAALFSYISYLVRTKIQKNKNQ